MAVRATLIPWHFNRRYSNRAYEELEGGWSVYMENSSIAKRLQFLRDVNANLVVSGDCMAALAVHDVPSTPVVWMDAHGDFNTPLTTRSGSLGGMPLAMLCGYGDQSIMQRIRQKPVWPDHVWHIGGSEFDPGERERMEKCLLNVKPTMIWAGLTTPVHLHIDLDVIRYADAPYSIHAAANGISLEEFRRFVAHIMPYTKILSIKSFDPQLDTQSRGMEITNDIIRSFYENGRHV